MAEERRRFSPPAVGGSSLLVIFAVLCLIIFALLSLSTVQAGVRLADAARSSVEGYYAADSEAEATLALLRAGDVPDGVDVTEDGKEITASFTCPISDTQELQVEAVFNGELGDDYEITRWQAVPTTEGVLDQDITVWDGGGVAI